MNLLRDVKTYIETHQLLKSGANVVVGVSGGPDSVTLLHVLRQIAVSLDLTLHVAHLHHSIRANEADRDADFVAALAKAWDLPYTIERVDLPSIAEKQKLALEEAARRVRYEFLCRVAEHVEAHIVAVGHNADDQAETVLMHLLRGAGPSGLRGMLPATRLKDYRLLSQNGKSTPDMILIRPLLNIPRADIERYCEEEALDTCFDTSNLDTTFFRNQLRHEVLPYLANINPRIAQRLHNLAEVIRADYELIREFTRVAWDSLLIQTYPDALVFDLKGWRAQSLSVRRAIVRRAAYKLRHTLRDVDFVHIESAVRIAQHGNTGAEATLPRGLRLSVGYSTLTIADQNAFHLPLEKPWLAPNSRIPLSVPGTIDLLNGWRLCAKHAEHWNLDLIAENTNPLVAWINADTLGDAVIVRTRQRGDRFQPQGMQGANVRLSDLLINAKVPRTWRNYLPLLESNGHILWVSGLRLSDLAKVKPETQRVVYLRFQGPATKEESC